MNKVQTELGLNNSGGSDWLDERMLDRLRAMGWYWEGSHLNRRGIPYRIYRDLSEKRARIEFQEATGYTGDELGCYECCGQPFYWHENEGDMIEQIDTGGEFDPSRNCQPPLAPEYDEQALAWLALIGKTI